MQSLIIACALALLVPLAAVIAWLIFAVHNNRSAINSISATVARLDSLISSLGASIEQRNPATLAARLDDLTAAVDSHQARTRKELGKLWGTIGATRSSGPQLDDGATDDDLAAMIALQSAPSHKPG